MKLNANYAALRSTVEDHDIRGAAATLLTTLEALAGDSRELREGPNCRLKSGAVAAVAGHVAGKFARAGVKVGPQEILDALTAAGLVTHGRDGEDVVFTLHPVN